MVLPNGKMKLFRAFRQPMTFQRVLKMPILVCFYLCYFLSYHYDFVSKEKIFHMMMMMMMVILLIVIYHFYFYYLFVM